MVVLGPPWDVSLWLYPGANPAVDAGLWGLPEDISTKIRYPGASGGQVVTYSSGRPEGAAQPDPGQMTLTLDNADGRFSTHNALGAYYPLLDLNTPIRLGVTTINDTFTRSSSSGWGTADTGNVWSVSGTATDWTINGSSGQVTIPAANSAVVGIAGFAHALDCDVVCVIIPNATATGASYGAGPIVRYTDTNNMIFATLEFNTAGTVTVKIRKRVAGVETEIASLSPIPVLTYSAAQRWRIRVQADGPTIRAKVWLESGSEPATWHISATEDTLTGAGIGLYLARFVGNTNATGQFGIDDFKTVGLEFTGNVAKWPVRWDMSGQDCYAPITAFGILSRLERAKGALQTPLEHQLPFYDPNGYWTLQDGVDSTSFASALIGGLPAVFNQSLVTPADESTLAGGSVAPTFSAANATIRGSCPPTGGTGFSAMWFMKLSALPTTKTLVAQFRTAAGLVRQWRFSIDATLQYLDGYDIAGASVVASSASPGGDFTQWMAFQLETDVVGANTEWAMLNHQVGSTVFYSQSGSFASTAVSSANSFILGGTDLLGAAFAHVYLGENTLPFVADTFSLVSSGYSGELASDRIDRIAAQSGIIVAIEPGTSQACGPQRSLEPIIELQAAASADFGTLYERGSALGYQPRSQRYNKSVLFDLSVAAGQIAEPPEPIRDDQRIRNRWKVSRDNGSYALVSDPDSIAAVGEYPDEAVINVATDDVLIGHGQLRTFLGSRKALRWPGLNLDFTRNPDLLREWRSKGFGPRLTAVTGRTQLIGADPDLIVEGYTCQLTPNQWLADLACSEAAPWDVGVYDDAVYRYDSGSTTTGAAYDDNDTSIVFSTTDIDDVWSTTSEPYDVIISGETVTVTSMGAVSGAGPYVQTATVTRGVGGFAKSLPVGESINAARPARYAL